MGALLENRSNSSAELRTFTLRSLTCTDSGNCQDKPLRALSD